MGTAGMAMFDRIVMNIITQRGKFVFAADGVFPESGLP
jgi:hypothetical protein